MFEQASRGRSRLRDQIIRNDLRTGQQHDSRIDFHMRNRESDTIVCRLSARRGGLKSVLNATVISSLRKFVQLQLSANAILQGGVEIED